MSHHNDHYDVTTHAGSMISSSVHWPPITFFRPIINGPQVGARSHDDQFMLSIKLLCRSNTILSQAPVAGLKCLDNFTGRMMLVVG